MTIFSKHFGGHGPPGYAYDNRGLIKRAK